MSIVTLLQNELTCRGADFIKFVDISHLPKKQNKGFPNAILLGMVLSPAYLQMVSNNPSYVEDMKKNHLLHTDEFHKKELKTDALADYTANLLTAKGHSSYSQSEANIDRTGFYNKQTKSTPLPNKTIAGMAGMGWIGKHNLLVTPSFGSAITMCSVLTDAPLQTSNQAISNSQCGTCTVCKEACKVEAIKGNTWELGTDRDKLVNVYKCTTCLQCMVLCPYTQNYINHN